MSAEYEGALEVAEKVDRVDDTLRRVADALEKLNAKLLPLLELVTEEIVKDRAAKKVK